MPDFGMFFWNGVCTKCLKMKTFNNTTSLKRICDMKSCWGDDITFETNTFSTMPLSLHFLDIKVNTGITVKPTLSMLKKNKDLNHGHYTILLKDLVETRSFNEKPFLTESPMRCFRSDIQKTLHSDAAIHPLKEHLIPFFVILNNIMVFHPLMNLEIRILFIITICLLSYWSIIDLSDYFGYRVYRHNKTNKVYIFFSPALRMALSKLKLTIPKFQHLVNTVI